MARDENTSNKLEQKSPRLLRGRKGTADEKSGGSSRQKTAPKKKKKT
jgi:hypothetical protein